VDVLGKTLVRAEPQSIAAKAERARDFSQPIPIPQKGPVDPHVQELKALGKENWGGAESVDEFLAKVRQTEGTAVHRMPKGAPAKPAAAPEAAASAAKEVKPSHISQRRMTPVPPRGSGAKTPPAKAPTSIFARSKKLAPAGVAATGGAGAGYSYEKAASVSPATLVAKGLRGAGGFVRAHPKTVGATALIGGFGGYGAATGTTAQHPRGESPFKGGPLYGRVVRQGAKEVERGIDTGFDAYVSDLPARLQAEFQQSVRNIRG
jgi:hypothetical protein